MRSLAVIGFLAIVAAIAAAVYFFGGFYSISAVEPDPSIVAWAIGHVRDASIDRHAKEKPPSTLDSPAVVQAGARAFLERGCANCHGAPGVKWAKFSEGLRPDPPDLKDIANDTDVAEIFWVVKNGINMTGMPSFGRIGADDQEIWSIAAFVKKLPIISEADFKAWTSPAANAPPASSAPPAQPQSAPPSSSQH
ncbi:MAG TPA: cytochrome c [Stellaceae bacterium]|nr:cytochrome c [Stellaceae bacterium]